MPQATGWKLDPGQRAELIQQFPPRYQEVVADHVTLESGVPPGAPPPPAPAEAAIVGRADDGAGVEALVVRLDGATGRPDGSTFHITWSLGPGREARESNDVIARCGWTDFELPMPVRLIPARWP
ncbi:MAG TPA: hypothetical protein VGW40_02315 [Allosphingosinicella sp.]|nr:hypothetical protein [Allosphingosinicella sp.]